MGEKARMTTADGDETARQLNVSATPGGNPAGILSAAVSSVSQLTDAPAAGDASKKASNPTYSTPGLAGDMPTI